MCVYIYIHKQSSDLRVKCLWRKKKEIIQSSIVVIRRETDHVNKVFLELTFSCTPS